MLRRALIILFRPWSARAATSTTVVAGIVLFLVLDRSAAMRRAEWGVDEGQRIAESYFLRLVLQGDFDHPDWTRVLTDSSHPQMSKYWFGIALLIAGVDLPRDLALPRYYEHGGLAKTGWTPPPHLIPVYGPMLRPARRAALLCNVISWMAATWLLLRWYGIGAALLAALVFVRHYLPVTLFAAARSDALQTCTFTLTLLPVATIWRGVRGWRAVVAAILAGVFAALCFQTRLNGLLALGGAGFVLLVLAIRTRDRRPLVLAAVTTLTCLAVSFASNPYYWPDVLGRFRQQVADLGILLHDHAYAALPTTLERIRFVGGVLFSGVAGLILGAGLLAAIAMCFVQAARERLLLACAWCLPVLAVFTLWLPLAWEPYVMLVFPTVVLLAASGWSAIAASWSRSSEPQAAEGRTSGHSG